MAVQDKTPRLVSSVGFPISDGVVRDVKWSWGEGSPISNTAYVLFPGYNSSGRPKVNYYSFDGTTYTDLVPSSWFVPDDNNVGGAAATCWC